MTSDGSAKQQLLDAVIAHVSTHGIGDLSLRELAGELGTSHRMLIYHFGSKDGLLRAIVEEIERQQRAVLAGLLADPDITVAEFSRRFWKQLSEPALWPFVRLFFEVYVQALNGRPHAVPLLDAVLEPMYEPIIELHRRQGWSPKQARLRARLGVASTRGLLLELLATEDRKAADDVMKLMIEVTELDLQRRPAR